MAKQYIRNDEGMIKDDQGRWIPAAADNKDYVAAIRDQARGELIIADAPPNVTPRPPAINHELLVTLIADLKAVAARSGVATDAKLDGFVTKADESGAAVSIDAEPGIK